LGGLPLPPWEKENTQAAQKKKGIRAKDGEGKKRSLVKRKGEVPSSGLSQMLRGKGEKRGIDVPASRRKGKLNRVRA